MNRLHHQRLLSIVLLLLSSMIMLTNSLADSQGDPLNRSVAGSVDDSVTNTAGHAIDQLTVTAEQLELNQNTGIQTLSGNVVITRNDITIYADTILVTLSFGAISRIVGNGSPIRFEQQLGNGEMISTASNQIDYQTRSWTVVFDGNVVFERNNQQLRAQRVAYNLRNKSYSADNGGDAAAPRVEFNFTRQ